MSQKNSPTLRHGSMKDKKLTLDDVIETLMFWVKCAKN